MSAAAGPYDVSFPAMGTDCAIRLFAGEGLALRAAAAAEAEIERIEAKFSRYRPGSLLSQLNLTAASGGAIEVDAETAFFIDTAFAAWRNSDGAFDVTSGVLRQAWGRFDGRLPDRGAIERLVPRIGLDKVIWETPLLRFPVPGMDIDFGGLAKEYAADRAADLCRDLGITSGLVDLGGGMAVVGPLPDGRAWDIGSRDPAGGAVPVASFAVESGGIATSGDYARAITIDGRRYGHILDPRTGWPVEGLASVTVVAESAMLAGLIATMAMLRGRQGVEWLATRGKPYLAIDAAGAIVGQSGTRLR